MGALIAAHYAADLTNDPQLAGLILVSPPVLMADDLARLPDQIYTHSYRTLVRLATAEPAIEVIASASPASAANTSKLPPSPKPWNTSS